MYKILLYTMMSLIFPMNIYAACSWNGNTGTAASTSRDEVAACVTAAQSKSGDVVINIPPGNSSSWGSAISVSIGNNGKLSILGAGVGNTTINHTSATLFSVTVNGGNQFFELGNITFTSASTASDGAVVNITGTRESRPKFRVHNCVFNHAPYRVLAAVKVYGVYDHNTDNDAQNQVIIVQGGMSTADQNAAFNEALGIGGSNAVFIEDNISHSTTYHQLAFVEAEFGSRAVIRHNTVYDRGINTHGYHDVDSTSRGSILTELYNNYFACTITACTHGWTTIRGGVFYIYNNEVVESSGKEWSTWLSGRGINIHYYGMCRDRCGAANDGDGECTTYPCSDQPGYFGLTPSPMYIWSNTFPANFFNFYDVPCNDGQNCTTSPTASGSCSGGTDQQTCFIRETRDYYLSAPSGYVAYPYPHPLTTGNVYSNPKPNPPLLH